ncbi:MAG TPA: hypothetical protein VKO20_02865 [Desulfosalsimonadaceae bacterium]|nr:hypothetical protein [Desulfosalsimonadaceae bacterium]
MDETGEKILEILKSAEKSLSPAEIAEAMDNQSACDIDRQRLNRIFQTLIRMVDEGSLDFDPEDPLCFRLAG